MIFCVKAVLRIICSKLCCSIILHFQGVLGNLFIVAILHSYMFCAQEGISNKVFYGGCNIKRGS